jgi:hypothetical protein
MLAVWPPYLAVAIPGLPWITPVRVTLALLMLGLLLQMSQSSSARSELRGVAVAIKPALVGYGLFWLFAFATVVMSSTPGDSFVSSLNYLILWNMPFIAAGWILIDKNALPRMVRLLMFCIAFVFVLTVLEYRQREPIWFNHIPSFLKVDEAVLAVILGDQGRVGDDRYRARGTFGVPLYYAQFILMLTPFMVHAAFTERAKKQAAALALLLFALVVCWMTNTRTGLTGFIVVVSGSVALYGLRRTLNPTSKSDMVAPAVFIAAPVGILMLLVAIAASPRLQSMTLGGAQHAGSDQVRGNQWDRALAALANNPLGYGTNSSGPIAGKPNAGGIWIVDSNWINFLLDYGVIGACGFALFAGLAIFYGVQIYLRNLDKSADLCGPAAVSIGSFLMTMYTISYVGSFPFLLVLVGAISATRYRLLRDGRLTTYPSMQPTLAGLPVLGRQVNR